MYYMYYVCIVTVHTYCIVRFSAHLINVGIYILKINFCNGILKSKDFSRNWGMIEKHTMALHQKQKRRLILIHSQSSLFMFDIC